MMEMEEKDDQHNNSVVRNGLHYEFGPVGLAGRFAPAGTESDFNDPPIWS